MEAKQRKIQVISSETASSVHWTRKALNYRIPRRGANYTLLSIVVDSVSAVLAPMLVINILAGIIQPYQASAFMPFWALLSCLVLSRVVTFNALGIYSSSEQPRFIAELGSVTFATIGSMLLLLGILSLAEAAVSLQWAAGVTAASLLSHLGWRTAIYFWSYYSSIRRILAPQRVLIIGATELGRELSTIINQFPLPTAHVVGFLDNTVTGTFNDVSIVGTLDDDIFKIIKEHAVDEIILTTTRHITRETSSSILNLQYVPVPVWLVPNYLKLGLYSGIADNLAQLPLVSLRQPAIAGHERLMKRAMDITAASIGLLLALPVFSMIAFFIWLTDRGPIFFRQERYGENGKIFHMLKFRSMVVNADKLVDEVKITDDDGKTIYKRQNDPRITPIGQIIRKTSLDELPQLINILTGEMSIVGPRPEVRKIVETEYQPWQFERMRVPQGLTGWWQVNGRSEKECYTDTEKDLYYINNYSTWLDIRIILMTIPALLKGKGAY